ncbi:ABC transporter permease, partial [Azospirillum brasilense]|nr:ABC transporter permease [Azospirillum brasilense]
MRSLLTDRLALGLLVLAALVLGMPALKPLFAAAFPALDRPLYEADGFLALTLDHLALAGGASLIAVLLGGA